MNSQPNDSLLEIPGEPDDWNALLEASGQEQITALACQKCGCYHFHLTSTADAEKYQAICVGCLEVVSK